MVELPKRVLHIELLADAIDVECIVAAVAREGTVALLAQTVGIAASAGAIDVQAGVIVPMEGTEIQSAPSGGSSAIRPDERLDVNILVKAGDRYPFASALALWPGRWPGRLRRGDGERCNRILAVGLAQGGERSRWVIVNADLLPVEDEITEAARVHMACQWQARYGVDRTRLDPPCRLCDRGDEPGAELLQAVLRSELIEGQPDVAALLAFVPARPRAILAEGPQLALLGGGDQRVDRGAAAGVDIQWQHVGLAVHGGRGGQGDLARQMPAEQGSGDDPTPLVVFLSKVLGLGGGEHQRVAPRHMS